MINCKKHIIAAGFTLMIPLIGWSEAPVIDDSDNFAMIDEQQEPSAARSKYDGPQIENGQLDGPQNEYYSQSEDGPALVQDDQSSDTPNDMSDNAKLINKILALQKDIQELRGQLEVQAHDLKLLQQQQVAFYKDLDARIGNNGAKTAQSKSPVDMTPAAKPASTAAAVPSATKTAVTPQPAIAVSRANPADEQISYMAAYELVQNKRYDNAISAMQTFVQKYPKGGYTANAQYWLGELYLVKKNYSQSIEHFDIVLSQFPSSNKSAASMLKIGYAYAANGNKQEAIKRLQQVVTRYPGTPTAKLANSKLELIKAS